MRQFATPCDNLRRLKMSEINENNMEINENIVEEKKIRIKRIPTTATVYKIYHRDRPDMFYIGSTSDTLTKRWYRHRCDCTKHPNDKRAFFEYLRLYNFDAFGIVALKQMPYTSKRNLMLQEDLLIQELKPKLNTNRAYLSPEDKKLYRKNLPKRFKCDLCSYGTYENNDFQLHLITNKHKKNQLLAALAEAMRQLNEFTTNLNDDDDNNNNNDNSSN